MEMGGGKLHKDLCFKGDGFAGPIILLVYNIDEFIRATGLNVITEELNIGALLNQTLAEWDPHR